MNRVADPPPHSLEAEQAVLGGLLQLANAGESEQITTALRTLGPEHFYVRAHRTIFSAVKALHDGGRLPDPVAVTARLRETGQLDSIGGLGYGPDGGAGWAVRLSGSAYITSLLNATFSPVTVPQHTEILNRYRAKRAVGELGNYLQDHARNGQDLEALAAFAGRVLDDVREAVFDSFTARDGVVKESNWLTAPDLVTQAASAQRIPWFPVLRQEGIIGRGLVTLVSAYSKTGKSTTTLLIVRGLLRETGGLRIAWLTEDPQSLWIDRLRRYPDLATRSLTLVFANGTLWPRTLAQLKRAEADLIIVDTIRAFCGIADENDQAGVTSAIQPLVFLTRHKNWAALLNHHLRKAPAQDGLGHAGSHALVGHVDIAIEMHRDTHSPRRRLCKAVSRFDVTPAEWITELRDDDLHFLGTPGALSASELADRIEAVLDGTPRTRNAISAILDPRPSIGALQAALDALTRANRALRDGRGAKGSPYRWRRP